LLYQAKIEREDRGGSVDRGEIRRRFEQKVQGAIPMDNVSENIPLSSPTFAVAPVKKPVEAIRWATGLFIIGCAFFFIGIQFAIPLSMAIAGVIFLVALWLMIKDLIRIGRTRNTKDKLT
jgi:hypothetical protein